MTKAFNKSHTDTKWQQSVKKQPQRIAKHKVNKCKRQKYQKGTHNQPQTEDMQKRITQNDKKQPQRDIKSHKMTQTNQKETRNVQNDPKTIILRQQATFWTEF